MDSAKLLWSWQFPCGCVGNLENPTHKYDDCPKGDDLFWSERFTELGRTIKMPLQQDEILEVKCSIKVRDVESEKLQKLVEEAEELLGETGMEYYDIFIRRLQREQETERLSVLEQHSFYSRAKDWYLENNLSPIHYEEVKINVCMKYLAEKMLASLADKEETVIDAIWTPNCTETEELLFSEHVSKIGEIDHVTSCDEPIKAADK